VLGHLALFFLPLVNNSNLGKTMLSTKRFEGNLTITTVGNTSTITLHSPTVIVEGDLTVRGTTINNSLVSLETTNTVIQDNIVTLNGGATGLPFASLVSGIEVNRGSRPPVGIRWNEGLSRWEYSDDNINWYEFLKGPYLKHVVDDPAPQLGGNLDTNGRSIFFTRLTGTQIPGTNPNYIAVYGAPTGAGGTGIKFVGFSAKSGTYLRDEFVSRKKSIVHALIF
jgi:hypothetical protein